MDYKYNPARIAIATIVTPITTKITHFFLFGFRIFISALSVSALCGNSSISYVYHKKRCGYPQRYIAKNYEMLRPTLPSLFLCFFLLFRKLFHHINNFPPIIRPTLWTRCMGWNLCLALLARNKHQLFNAMMTASHVSLRFGCAFLWNCHRYV